MDEIVKCPRCGRQNRIHGPRGGTFRCGSCKQDLDLWVVDAEHTSGDSTPKTTNEPDVKCRYRWRVGCLERDRRGASFDLVLSRLEKALEKKRINTAEFSELEVLLKEHSDSKCFWEVEREDIWLKKSLPHIVSERQGSLLCKAGISQQQMNDD